MGQGDTPIICHELVLGTGRVVPHPCPGHSINSSWYWLDLYPYMTPEERNQPYCVTILILLSVVNIEEVGY